MTQPDSPLPSSKSGIRSHFSRRCKGWFVMVESTGGRMESEGSRKEQNAGRIVRIAARSEGALMRRGQAASSRITPIDDGPCIVKFTSARVSPVPAQSLPHSPVGWPRSQQWSVAGFGPESQRVSHCYPLIVAWAPTAASPRLTTSLRCSACARLLHRGGAIAPGERVPVHLQQRSPR